MAGLNIRKDSKVSIFVVMMVYTSCGGRWHGFGLPQSGQAAAALLVGASGPRGGRRWKVTQGAVSPQPGGAQSRVETGFTRRRARGLRFPTFGSPDLP